MKQRYKNSIDIQKLTKETEYYSLMSGRPSQVNNSNTSNPIIMVFLPLIDIYPSNMYKKFHENLMNSHTSIYCNNPKTSNPISMAFLPLTRQISQQCQLKKILKI